MKQIDYKEFYDLVVPRLFEVSDYQTMMCGKLENLGKPSQTNVTQTEIHGALSYLDQFTQDYLLLPIFQRWPDLVPVVEEDTGLKRNYIDNISEYSLIMDPIDGTAFYLRGEHDYSIMLGLMKQGEMVLGIVCYPEVGLVVAAIEGQGAWQQKKDGSKKSLARLETFKCNEEALCCHYRFKNKPYSVLAQKLIEVGYMLSTNDDGFGTNATGILRIANGESCAFIGPHISLHDFAIPAFIIQELGGVVKLYNYQGLNDVGSWFSVLQNYGSPDPRGANPRYRVIIGDSETTINSIVEKLLKGPLNKSHKIM